MERFRGLLVAFWRAALPVHRGWEGRGFLRLERIVLITRLRIDVSLLSPAHLKMRIS